MLQMELGRMSPEELERYNQLPRLRVWYGLRKLTKKAVRKKSICAMYENFAYWKNDRYPERMLHVFYQRHQTPLEKLDAVYQTRVLSVYEHLVDKGGMEECIDGFLLGEENLPEEEIRAIEKKLREKIAETNY